MPGTAPRFVRAGAGRHANMAGMARISRHIAAIHESATLAVDARAKAMKAAGEPVIGFGAGEPDFPTPAAHRRRRGGRVPGPEVPPLLADAGAARTAQRDRDEDEARLGRRRAARTGARHQRREARRLQHVPGAARPRRRGARARALLDVVPRVHRARRRRDRRAADHRGRRLSRVTVEQLDAACTDRTKALLFVSPSNPTGAVYPPDEVQAIGEWARDRGIFVVTDEIYEHLTYGEHEFASIAALVPDLADRCVILNGVAKTYAMTGWRVGWMIGAARRRSARRRTCSRTRRRTSRTSRRSRRSPRSPATSTRSRRCAGRSNGAAARCTNCSSGIPGVSVIEPQGAFYCFPSFESVLGREIGGRTPRHHAGAVRAAARSRRRSRSCPARRSARRATPRLSFALGDDDLGEGVRRIADLLS